MNNTSIFSFAKMHSDYLSVRQNVSAQNIANLSVPGYKSLNVSDFGSFLRTQTKIDPTGAANANTFKDYGTITSRLRNTIESPQNLSGNNVTLENEMANAGSIRREFNMNTTLLKSFHKMYLTSLKT